MHKDFDCEFKIILIGQSGVGKTSLTIRYERGEFRSRRNATVIADIFRKDITLRGKKVRLKIWDTAGQERFKADVKGYFRDVDGVLLVYDVTDILTFNELSNWLTEVREQSSGATTLIVGNKIDHPNGKSVTRRVVQQFASAENMEFMEASAKNGDNVEQVFEYLTLKILQAKGVLPLDDLKFSPPKGTHQELNSGVNSAMNTHSGKEQPDTPKTSVSRQQQDNQLETPKVTNSSIPNTSSTSRHTAEVQIHHQTSSNQKILETSFVNGVSGLSTDSSDLPPIVPLTGDIIELYIERKRKSSVGSITSFMPVPEPEHERGIRLHEEPPQTEKPKSSCY